MSQQKSIRCTIMRGGTSKAVMFIENDLPHDKKQRDETLLKIFGSPDVRQIDGLGGADPLTSKLAIIGPSTHADADIDYTFGQVVIDKPLVGYHGNCGNVSSAVAPFAIEKGLVRADEKLTVVRVHNTNTGRIFISEVPMVNGEVAVEGDCRIDGVPGTGAKIMMDYSKMSGCITGKLLPTGNPQDLLDVPGVGEIKASLVDAGNPVVFVHAEDLGLTGIEKPDEVDGNPDLLKRLELIRSAAGVKMGLTTDFTSFTSDSPGLPMLAFVNNPTEYEDFTSGKKILSDQIDFVSRSMFMQVVHKTYAGTAAVCTACAAKIKGSVVYNVMNDPETQKIIRIGHPAGVFEVESDAEYKAGETLITRAAIYRTARLIMDGRVYIR